MNYLGLDLGQTNDPSAIAIVERMEHAGRFLCLRVRYLKRVPLGTPYPHVVDLVRRIVSHPDLYGNCAIAADATGVGKPVVDMLRAAQLGCDLAPVNITSGDKESRSGLMWNVPKQDLLASVHLLLDRDELKFAAHMKELGALIRELTDFRSVTQPTGRVRLGADGFNEHDDLVIALALACWRAQRRQNQFGTQRLI